MVGALRATGYAKGMHKSLVTSLRREAFEKVAAGGEGEIDVGR
jgi:hypothetical protein